MSSCADGYYSNYGDGVCTYCPAGYRCHEKHLAPQQCESGYYSLPGYMECTICPSGHYCPQTTAQPSICPQGEWAPQGAYECYECPAGSICDNTAGNDDALTSVSCEYYEITTWQHDLCYVSCPFRPYNCLGMPCWL